MSAKRQRGMTLVELMIGLTLSLVTAMIIGAIYVNSKSVFTAQSANSRVQESMRFGTDMLANDLRMAGFFGCRVSQNTPVNTLNAGSNPDNYWYQYINPTNGQAQGITGYHGSGGNWSPALDTALSETISPIANTDVVSVWLADPEQTGASLIQPMMAGTDAVTVGANSIFNLGDIALVTDCNNAALFEITSPNPGAGTLAHAAAASPIPGNASGSLNINFAPPASVYRLSSRTYYIAPTAQAGLPAGTNSLWRYCMPSCDGPPATNGTGQAEEVMVGVDNLLMLYGLAGNGAFGAGAGSSGDGNATEYLTADQVGPVGATNWSNIVSAKLQMLIATPQTGIATAGQTTVFNGTTYSDSRGRTVFTTLISLRQRTQ